MKQKLASEEEQELYDMGYECGSSNLFVPIIAIGICCFVGGVVIGLCISMPP